MGTKVKISVTILGVSKMGWAYAPYKKATGNKKTVKDPNDRPLFELVKSNDKFTGVTMFSFKKANSNFDRGDHDSSVFATLHIGQVCGKERERERDYRKTERDERDRDYQKF